MSNVSITDTAGNDLAAIATRIRNSHRGAQSAWCNALHHALDAGDALIEAKSRIATGWKRWLRDDCFLSVRTAMLYVQLARHRTEIEGEIQRVGELSLRAARRLIATSSEKAPKPKRLVPDLLVAWNRTPDPEKTAVLGKINLLEFLRVMPASWRTELKARGIDLNTSTAGEPDPRISKIIRTALSSVVIADSPETGKPAALGQEHAALAALRAANAALRAIGRDLHEVEVVLGNPKMKRASKAKRAA